jgi:hypothetical protein
MHFYSATRSHREIFSLTVMDTARSLVFDMVLGDLVISRHNEIRDELSDLASKAFILSAVRDDQP